MSASDYLNVDQFYHASPYKMAKGTVMTPDSNAAHGKNFNQSSGRTYVTDSLDTAHWMGESMQSPKVYDVQPQGRLIQDENLRSSGSWETPDPVTVLGRHVYTPPAAPAQPAGKPSAGPPPAPKNWARL